MPLIPKLSQFWSCRDLGTKKSHLYHPAHGTLSGPMPYVIVTGNLTERRPRASGTNHPFKVSVSGLKAVDLEQLARFKEVCWPDSYTIAYAQHPCVILSALEVLGFQVVSSCRAHSTDEDAKDYVWTLKRALPSPDDSEGESDQ